MLEPPTAGFFVEAIVLDHHIQAAAITFERDALGRGFASFVNTASSTTGEGGRGAMSVVVYKEMVSDSRGVG
jgi:hypothetical protein